MFVWTQWSSGLVLAWVCLAGRQGKGVREREGENTGEGGKEGERVQ